MFFNEELLNSIAKKKCADPSLLKIIAEGGQRFQKVVSQLNTLYDELPAEAKQDKNLNRRLTSIHEADFKGALAEVVTNAVLKRFNFQAFFEPQIRTAKGIVKPDFYAQKASRTFIVETFSPGYSKEQSRRKNNLRNALAELPKVKDKCHIILYGYPHPDPSGGFDGISDAFSVFFKTHTPDPSVVHSITSKAGAVVAFSFCEVLQDAEGVRWGWLDNQGSRSSFHEKIIEELRTKRKKYKFPFVASCVLMPTVWCDPHSFYRALVGDPLFMVPVALGPSRENLPPAVTTNNFSGFWGFKGADFHRNHLVQAVMYTHIMWSDSGGIKLVVSLYENPHFLTDLRNEFPGVPDLLRYSEETEKPCILDV